MNADLIAAGLSPFKPESQAVAAGKLMLARMDDLTVGRQTFAFETTLAGRGHAKRLQSMKAVGYRIVMFFIWLPAAEMAIARVASRVREGGHDIPQPTVRRRYALGMKNFAELYAPMLDSWYVYNGARWPAEIVICEQDGERQTYNEATLAEIKRHSPELLP